MRLIWKYLKPILFITGIPLTILAILLGPFMVQMYFASREATAKVQEFCSLSAREYQTLISLSQKLADREGHLPHGFKDYGRVPEPPVPAAFHRFGFERMQVRKDEVEGRLYYLFDSGGYVRVRFSPLPTIDLLQGDRDIVTRIYP